MIKKRITMKKINLLLCILLLSSFSFCQLSTQSPPQTYTVSSQGPLILPVIGSGTQYYQISWNVIGSLSACIVEVDSSTTGTGSWGSGDIIASQACTSSGNFTSTAHTVNYVRINTAASIAGSGSLVVTLTGYLNNPANGGSGTVNANSGTANSLAIYAAAGGSTTVGPDATAIDNGVTFTYSGTTGYVGPAGTTTQCGYCFTGALTTGIAEASNVLYLLSNGVTIAQLTGGIEITATATFKFSQTASATGAPGLSLGTVGSGVNEVFTLGGTSTNQFLQSGACKPGLITLSTSATTICSFNLPNSAQSWGIICSGTYSVTAGTTPTFSLGVNPSQTPTGGTLVTGVISSTSSGVAVTEISTTTTVSASGNTNIATSATLTTVTNALWTLFGQLAASATAGTVAITGTLGGTTPTGTIPAGGTVCYIL
jgi:hypothetical protein